MLFSNDSNEARAYNEVEEGHTAKLSHEVIAGAASYAAAKKYEEHVKRQGKPVNHETAVALLAGLTGVFIDRVAETKGLDALEREHVKHSAHKRATEALAQSGDY